MEYPIHLAAIPDGCRRWAEERGKMPWEGHKKGIETLEEVAKWGFNNTPIKYFTVYGLSMENLQRPKAQLSALDRLYSEHFARIAADEDIHKNEVRVDMIGREELLPKRIKAAVKKAREETGKYNKRFLYIALAYSGRAEIIDAVKKVKGELTEEAVSKNLYANAPEPDLIIRTAEQRMSNFLLWQGAYAELYFFDKHWPDFTIEDLKKALEAYNERKRRFGK
ncbi:MAG: polyprenyl diphosphate synthase [archaeon]